MADQTVKAHLQGGPFDGRVVEVPGELPDLKLPVPSDLIAGLQGGFALYRPFAGAMVVGDAETMHVGYHFVREERMPPMPRAGGLWGRADD